MPLTPILAISTLGLLVLSLAGGASGNAPGILLPCTLIAFGIAFWRLDRRSSQTRRLFWASLLIFVLGVMQWIPLSRDLLGEPRAAAFEQAEAVIDRAFEAGIGVERPKIRSRLSLHAPGTARALLAIGLAWAAFWITASLTGTWRRHLLTVLFVLVSVVAAASCFGQLAAPSFWSFTPYLADGLERPIGLFSNRNIFGAFCAMFLPFAVAITCEAIGRRRDFTDFPWPPLVCALVCMVALTACLMQVNSRGALLGAAAGIGLTSVLWINTRHRRAAAAVVLGVGLIICMVLWPRRGLNKRFEGDNRLQTALQTRALVWQDAVSLWKQYPITGCGLGAYRQVSRTVAAYGSEKTTRHAEHQYLTWLAEGGLLLALLGMAVLALWLWTIRQDSEQAERHTPLRLGAYGCLAAVAVHGLLDVPLYSPLNLLCFAILLAMAMPKPWTRKATVQRKATAAVVLALLLPIYFLGLDFESRFNSGPLYQASSSELLNNLADSPTYWLIYYQLANRLATINDPTPAQQALSLDCLRYAAELKTSDARLWMELAERQQRRRAIPAARAAYAQALRWNPQDNGYWQRAIRFEQTFRNYQQALALAERAVAAMENPTMQEQMMALQANLLIEAGHFEAGAQRLRDCIEMTMRPAHYWLKLGQVGGQCAQPSLLREGYSAYLKLHPRDNKARLAYAQALLRLSDPNAKNEIEILRKFAPKLLNQLPANKN